MAAKTGDDCVVKMSAKAVIVLEEPFYLTKEVIRAFLGPSTTGAHQMMVVSFLGMVVNEAAPGVALDDTSCLFQYVKRPVDGRLVDPGHPLLDVVDNLLGGKVCMTVMDDIDYEPSLRRQLQALSFQRFKATHRNCTWLQVYTRPFVGVNLQGQLQDNRDAHRPASGMAWRITDGVIVLCRCRSGGSLIRALGRAHRREPVRRKEVLDSPHQKGKGEGLNPSPFPF
jgi:hypothetical protein